MSNMKDSGIAWVGEYPEHWESKRGKYLLRLLQKPVKDGDGVITCFRDGEVTLRSNRREEGFTIAEKEHGYQGVDVGDLVVHGMDGFAGAIGISDSRGKSSPVLNILDTILDKKYTMYYLRSVAYGNVFLALATGIRVRSCDLRWNKLAELRFPVPPVEEQRAIANFLDSKCAEIDALMEDIRAEISTLEEYKKSVITEAVTKGLNPDAEMKDSGIAWVGKCPEHWKILKIRDSISKIESGVSVNAASYPAGDNEIGVLKTSCVSKYIFDARENKAVNKNEESRVSCPVRKGCIIVSRMNTPDLVGACGYVAEEVNGIYLPDRLWQVHVKTTYSAQYVTYYLMSHIARSYYASIAVGTSSTMQNISQKEFGCMFFCVPEIEEQQAIADYLDAKCDEIAATIAEKQKQLTTLEEYKKSLIYEYVTGKKEVPTL